MPHYLRNSLFFAFFLTQNLHINLYHIIFVSEITEEEARRLSPLSFVEFK
jgi:hypothetical protein